MKSVELSTASESGFGDDAGGKRPAEVMVTMIKKTKTRKEQNREEFAAAILCTNLRFYCDCDSAMVERVGGSSNGMDGACNCGNATGGVIGSLNAHCCGSRVGCCLLNMVAYGFVVSCAMRSHFVLY